jgi:hypothetical protein
MDLHEHACKIFKTIRISAVVNGRIMQKRGTVLAQMAYLVGFQNLPSQ